MKLLLPLALVAITFHVGYAQTQIAAFQEIPATRAIDGKVYFSATHDEYGIELFVNDGTGNSNTLLKDINPGYVNSLPSELTEFNNQLFFIAYSPEYGGSLWKTDGTPLGTQLVYGVKNADPRGLMLFKDKLYFTTNVGSIMQSDGTSAGTQVFYQSDYTYGRIQSVINDDQYIYFTSDGRTIYRDDGTSRINFLGPLSWEDVYFKTLFSLGNSLVVVKSSSYDNVIRMYAIDNNVLGDQEEDEWRLIKKLDAPIYGSQYIANFTIIGGKMYFNFRTYYENVPPSDELWISDGSEAGTKMVKSFAWSPHNANSNMGMFFDFHGKLFFRGGESVNQALWTSDGTTAGTVKFHDSSVVPGYNDDRLPVLVAQNKFYFSGGTMNNAELWHSDGTVEGTKQLLDLDDAGSSWPHDLTMSNGILYFTTSKQFLSTLWSATPAPNIALRGGYSNAIASGSTPLLFYNVSKGACQTTDLVIVNKGLSELYLRSVYVTGRDFYIVKQTLPEVLAPGASVTIKLVFNPVVDGNSTATLTILSNDNDQPRYIVNLQGNTSNLTAGQICQFPQNEYIKILNPGENTTSIILSNSSVTEDQPAGTAIGQFSFATASSFSLTAGEGDADNDKFYIEGNQLRTNTIFDYDERTLFTLRVKATTAEDETETSFRISVINASKVFTTDDCQRRFELMSFSYNALESNAAGHLFTTTSLGQVLRSMNAGQTWEVVYDGDPFEVADITFTGSTGFIAATKVLLKSDDSGATWFRIYLPLNGEYYFSALAANFLNDNEGYVGTEAGELFFTGDGGHSWETRQQNTTTQFRSLFFLSKDKGFAITGYGDLTQTVDGGRSWLPVDLSTLGWSNRVRDIYFTSNEKGFLISDYNVYTTSNGGQSWTQIPDVAGAYLGRIKFLNENLAFLYGGEGLLYKTTNGGDTWDIILERGAPGSVIGVAQSSSNIFVASRSNSSYQSRALSVSSDNGVTWSNLNYYSGGNINNIEFYSQNKGVILSEGALFRTDDNGITWNQSTTDITGVADIVFVDENTAILVSYANIYKSTDGGFTTRLVLKTDTNENYTPAGKLYVAPGNTLFSVSWYAMYRSDDLGETWVLVSTMPDYYTQGMHFISSSIGYRVELFGSVQKTIDGGETWTNIFTREPETSDPFNAIFFLDENIGYKGGNFLQRTTDGGNTWETVKWPFYEIMGIHFENETHGYVVIRGGRVYETLDSGETWETIFTTSSRIADVQFRDDEIFIAGEYGFSARLNTVPRSPFMPGYIYGPDRICAGDAIDFRLAVDADYRTEWTTTAGNIEDRTNYVTVKFADPGEYTVTARYVNACGISDIRARTVNVYGPASKPLIDGPDTAANGQQDIAYTVTDVNDNSSYLWSVEGGAPTAAIDHGVLIDWGINAEVGKINVLQIDASGCRAYGSLVVALQVPLGIEDYLQEHISVYPNPSKADTRISSSYSGAVVVRILDVRGRELSRYTLTHGDEQSLNTRNLSPGLYLVEISDGQQSVTKKLIRE